MFEFFPVHSGLLLVSPTLPDFSALFQINKLIFKMKKLRLSTYHIPKMNSREPENRVLGPLKPTDH